MLNQIEQDYVKTISKHYLNNEFLSAEFWAKRLFEMMGADVTPEFIKVIAQWNGDYNIGYFTTINPLIAEYYRM